MDHETKLMPWTCLPLGLSQSVYMQVSPAIRTFWNTVGIYLLAAGDFAYFVF